MRARVGKLISRCEMGKDSLPANLKAKEINMWQRQDRRAIMREVQGWTG